MNAGKYDDYLVAGVSGFTDEANVVSRFAGLHMPHHQAAPIPRPRPLRIFDAFKDLVGNFVNAVGGRRGDAFLLVEAVSIPVAPTNRAAP